MCIYGTRAAGFYHARYACAVVLDVAGLAFCMPGDLTMPLDL